MLPCTVACELMVQHVRTKLEARGVAFKDEGSHILRTMADTPTAGIYQQRICPRSTMC